MAGSYFKGWVDTLPHIPTRAANKDTRELYFGHVLDVYYDETLPAKIRVRLIGVTQAYNDDDISIEAYPADLSVVKVPLPGEIVMIIQSIYTKSVDDDVQIAYYYFGLVATLQSVTYNSDPYIGQLLPEKIAEELFTGDYERRFDNKIKSLSSYKNTINEEPLTKKAFKPYEGDIIVQSRFGAGIRLGSTGDPMEDSPWSKNGGEQGNPIVVMTAHGEESTTETKLENVNQDNSSVYVCTTQVIEIKMATSNNFLSHRHKYDAKLKKPEDDYTQFLQTEYHVGAAFFAGTGPAADIGENMPPSFFGVMDPYVNTAYELTLGREGFIPIFQWDISNWRIGHGSSSITVYVPGVGVNAGQLKFGSVKDWSNNAKLWPISWKNKALTDYKTAFNFIDIGSQTALKYKHSNGTKGGPAFANGYIWDPRKHPLNNIGTTDPIVARFNGRIPCDRKNTPDGLTVFPDIITRLDANLDLTKNMQNDILPHIKSKIGDAAYATIGPGGVAALASIKYNYGNITQPGGVDLTKFVSSRQTLADAILRVDPTSERRKLEAQYALTR